jgi:hypothetical protein
MKTETISDEFRAELIRDLAELRALREELANTPPPCDPLEAFRKALRDGLNEQEQDEA